MTAPRLSAIDALGRGFANVRANRELILVQVASGLLLAASIVVLATVTLAVASFLKPSTPKRATATRKSIPPTCNRLSRPAAVVTVVK